jgi:hypothetical protein
MTLEGYGPCRKSSFQTSVMTSMSATLTPPGGLSILSLSRVDFGNKPKFRWLALTEDNDFVVAGFKL